MKNIVLIGFMGTGKTEVGKLLAKKLGFQYLDTDEMIEKREGRTINDIFAGPGESFFRETESEVLNNLSGIKSHVISTGGGIILRPENVKIMKELGKLVLLKASPRAIYDRLKGSDSRPLLSVEDPLAKINEILDFRTPIYEQVADLEVDTSSLSPEEACNKITEGLRGEL